MPIPRHRFFFDTSVYIAALLSPTGAAGELLRLCEAGAIDMVVSEEVITETDRVLSVKFPDMIQESRKLWKSLVPEVIENPKEESLNPFLKKLNRGDALILCGANVSRVSAFVTWNTRDFMAPGVEALVNFPIVVPAQGLSLFRKWIDPYLQ